MTFFPFCQTSSNSTAMTGVSRFALSIVFTSLHFSSVPNGMNRSGAGGTGRTALTGGDSNDPRSDA